MGAETAASGTVENKCEAGSETCTARSNQIHAPASLTRPKGLGPWPSKNCVLLMCVLFGGFSADGVTQDDLKSPRLGRRDVDTTGVSQIAWETRRTTHLILFEGAAILGLRTRWEPNSATAPRALLIRRLIHKDVSLLYAQVVPQFLRCEGELTQTSPCRDADTTLGLLCVFSHWTACSWCGRPLPFCRRTDGWRAM